MKDEDTDSDDQFNDDNPSVDRGWAWVVVVGALLINIIYDGCSYSFGIFFTKFLVYFGDTRSHTAWIGSLFFSVPLLCGPIAGYITRRIGYRKSTMIGGFIAAVGFSCGAFSNSIAVLCISYGIVAGFGMSLPYFNSIVVEAVYFKKRRALATGIAESGAGIGTVIFAPLTNYLISVYGWRGALLIVGGIVANILVCGAVFRPIRKQRKTENTDTPPNEICSLPCYAEKNDEADKMLNSNLHKTDVSIQEDMVQSDFANYHSSVDIMSDQSLTEDDKADRHHVSGTDNHPPADDEDIPPKSILSCSKLDLHMNSSRSNLNEDVKKSNRCVNFISKYVADMVILKNRGFILFSISNFIMYFWYDVPYVFLVDKAISMGITDTNATFLISIIGIVHTVGNICYGVLGDKEKINKTTLYGISIIFCGATVILMAIFTVYGALAVLAGLFGLFSAANEAMCSIILIEVVGLRHLNQAYGVIMMLQGAANLVGPPVAGWLCDLTGAYGTTFFAAGSCVMTAGLVYLLLPLLRRRLEADSS